MAGIDPPVRNAWMQNADTPLIIAQRENERLHHLLGEIVDQREELRRELQGAKRMLALAIHAAGGSVDIPPNDQRTDLWRLTRIDEPDGTIVLTVDDASSSAT